VSAAGDRVRGCKLPNSPAFAVLLLALWRLGAVAVTALPAYGERELRHVVDTSAAVAIAVASRPRRGQHLATVQVAATRPAESEHSARSR